MTSRLCMNSEFFHCHRYAITARTDNFLPWKGYTQKANDESHHSSGCYMLTMLKCPLSTSAPSLPISLSSCRVLVPQGTLSKNVLRWHMDFLELS